jgi:hypothetical protein
MNYQGITDADLPSTTKPSLQQYDNYQIYDLICVDKSPTQLNKDFLAIQSYSPRIIRTNFVAIANIYK